MIIDSEVYLAAIERNPGKLSALSHEELIDGCIGMARYIVKLQSSIVSRGQNEEAAEDYRNKDLVSSLRQEIKELKKKRPGGRQTVYTTKEKNLVLDMRKRGTVMREIAEATGMSMSTVKRILHTGH